MGTGAGKVFGREKRTVERIEIFCSILFFFSLRKLSTTLILSDLVHVRGKEMFFRWKVLSIIFVLCSVDVGRYNILKYQI